MGTQLTEHCFEYNGRKYFRGNAENVEICAYGEKKGALTPSPYMAVQNKVKSEHLGGRVHGLGAVSIDWNKISTADIGAKGFLNVFGVSGERAVSTSLDAAKSGNVKLVGFGINEGPLKVMLNTDADGARKYLADEGSDGRIASEVWVAMAAEMATKFAATAGYSVSANVAGLGLDISLNGSTGGSAKITISKGTTIAYALHKVKNWDKGKTKIENMEDDYDGLK